MGESTLAKKLGIKPGQRLLLLRIPEGYRQLLGVLPEGATVAETAGGTFDFVQLFVSHRAELEREAPQAIRAVTCDGLLWIAYPKKSSKVKSDITRDVGWEVMYEARLGPVTQIAIDEVWSALRFRPREK